MTYDALICGAGPAGSTAAILLARAGARVLLLDKARFPRDKLCGEFVSPEAIRILAETGVLSSLVKDAGRSAALLLTDEAGRRLRLPVPSPAGSHAAALGIPRLAMDHALVSRAAALGAEVLEQVEILSAGPGAGGRFSVTGRERGGGRERVFTARLLLAADGRDSALARVLSAGRRPGRASSLFGLKAHFELPPGFGDAVELHYVRGGYIGLQQVGARTLNACALIDRALTGPIPREPDAILERLFFRNPSARARLEGARRLTDWLAVGSLVFRREAPVRMGSLFLGDAAGTIDPFAGEGMSMALRSAEIAAAAILAALGSESLRGNGRPDRPKNLADVTDDFTLSSSDSHIDGRDHSGLGGSAGTRSAGPAAAAETYAREWKREFSRRILICRGLGRLAVRPSFQGPMLSFLGRFPSVGGLLARGTRIGAASD